MFFVCADRLFYRFLFPARVLRLLLLLLFVRPPPPFFRDPPPPPLVAFEEGLRGIGLIVVIMDVFHSLCNVRARRYKSVAGGTMDAKMLLLL